MSRVWNYDLYINGTWVKGEGGRELTVIDPATEEVIGHAAEGSPKDAARAIEAARKAFDEGPWPWMKPRERAAVLIRMGETLERREPELRELMISQTGSVGPLTDRAMAGGPIGMFRSNAELAQNGIQWVETAPPTGGPTGVGATAIVREPVGVVAAITPFNFPFMLNVVKTAPALAAGCTVVLKPHPWTPLDAFFIAEAAEEAGLPPGVLNVITGHGEVGEELTSNPGVDLVTHTGSTTTGRAIMASAAGTIKRLHLELGGKSAQIILDDVPESYVRSIGYGSVLNHCGQGCGIASRLLIPEKFLDAYKEGLEAMAPMIKIGSPRDPSTNLGPLTREEHRQRVERHVQNAIDDGAELLIGGKRPSHLDRGFFYEPTVFLASNDMRIAQEEVFGPVLTVIPYSGKDEDAIRLANDSIYGLTASAVAAQTARAFNVVRQIRAGRVFAEGVPASPLADLGRGNGQGPGWGMTPAGIGQTGAFGGFKQSGVGREWGRAGLELFTELKSLTWS